MELTAWQKICHRLLGGLFKKRARNDKELSDNLVKADMPIMPEVFLAQNMMITILVILFCVLLNIAFFFPVIGIVDYYESLPDESTAEACFVWEYWNDDLIDTTLPSNGCPYFTYLEFPVWVETLIPIIFGPVIPFLVFRYLKKGAARTAKARGAHS